jgi:undecaprenyl-diphosphatase
MDDAVVLRVNALVRSHPTLARVVGAAAERLAVVEVGLMLLLAVSGRRRSALRMLATVSTLYVTCEALGRVWPRKRPFEKLADVQSVVPHEPGRSFPSRHVASGLAMASIGSREHRRLGMLMAGVAWLLGFSRVAAGLHYPSDIAAGALLGLIFGRYVR